MKPNRLGRHQLAAFVFASKYAGWHSYAGDRATRDAVAGLERRGLVEVCRGSKQFRLK